MKNVDIKWPNIYATHWMKRMFTGVNLEIEKSPKGFIWTKIQTDFIVMLVFKECCEFGINIFRFSYLCSERCGSLKMKHLHNFVTCTWHMFDINLRNKLCFCFHIFYFTYDVYSTCYFGSGGILNMAPHTSQTPPVNQPCDVHARFTR